MSFWSKSVQKNHIKVTDFSVTFIFLLIAGGAMTSKSTLGGAFTSTFDTSPDKPDTMAGSAIFYYSLLVEAPIFLLPSVAYFHLLGVIFRWE